MQESNFYTVIIPAFNEASRLPKCIKGIIDQSSGHNIEIIVANASATTDDSRQVCNDYDCLFLDTPHCSRAAQMNYAAQYAQGNILIFVHADVLVPKNMFSHIEKATLMGNQYGWFSYRFDPPGILRRINSFLTKYDGAFAGGGDQCIFIDKTIFDQLGGYDERYCIMEDFELTRRVKQNNIAYKLIDEPATVSARKYTENSYMKVNLVNLKALRMFITGEDPVDIHKMYNEALS